MFSDSMDPAASLTTVIEKTQTERMWKNSETPIAVFEPQAGFSIIVWWLNWTLLLLVQRFIGSRRRPAVKLLLSPVSNLK